MKKIFSIMLMALAMITVTSCGSKSSETTEEKAKDATSLAKDCGSTAQKLASNPSDAEFLAATDVFVDSFDALLNLKEDDKDYQPLFTATAQLYQVMDVAAGSVKSQDTKDAVMKKMSKYENNEKALALMSKLQFANVPALAGAAPAEEVVTSSFEDVEMPEGVSYDQASEMVESAVGAAEAAVPAGF